MKEQEITENIETLVSEFSRIRKEYSELLEGDADKGEKGLIELERTALLAVASGPFNLLTDKIARSFAESIVKPTVAEKDKIVELECGNKGHRKAVFEYQLRLLEKQLKVVELASINAASIRKGERF